MAKAQRDLIFKRMPHVDFISGPAQLYEVPELISAIAVLAMVIAPDVDVTCTLPLTVVITSLIVTLVP